MTHAKASTIAYAWSWARQLAWWIDQVSDRPGNWSAAAFAPLPSAVDCNHLRAALAACGEQSEVPVAELAVVDAAGRSADEVTALARAEVSALTHAGAAVLPRRYRLTRGEDVLVLACPTTLADGSALGRLLATVLGHCRNDNRPAPGLLRWSVDSTGWPSTWPARLAGADTTITWPAPRPIGFDSVRRQRMIPIEPVTAHRLSQLAARERVTPGVMVAAALRILLAGHTGQRDLLFGLRGTLTETAVEPLADLLVVRNAVVPNEVFGTVLARESAAAEAAGGYCATLPQLAAKMCPDWTPGTAPLVQVVVVDQLAIADLDGIQCRGDELPFDLVVTVGGAADRPVLTWSWHRDVPVDALPDRLAMLLAAAVADPGTTVVDLPRLTATDWRLVELTGSAAPRLGTATVVDIIEDRVAGAPEAIAVGHDRGTRTYRQVWTCANRIAGQLAMLGAPAETRVGILLERGSDLPGTLLGVMLAGAVCVPLDAGQPVERLRFILRDAGVQVLLTDQDPEPYLAGSAVQVVRLPEGVPAPASSTIPARPAPDQLAYVLYTSGSTGTPKGVAVAHRGLANCLNATRDLMGCRPGERLLALTTVTFDIAFLELFLMLVSGGETVVASSQEARDGEALQAALARWRPEYVQATPVTWQMLLSCGWTGDPELTISCGGDVVSRALAVRPRASSKAFWHTYGPTEASMYTVCTPLPAGPLSQPVPIGTPLPGTAVQVLDEQLRPVPPGVVGELCIRGVGLARGYLNRPGLTASQFVPDPLVAGARLYRTGDLASLRSDGQLELRGRNDRQVKIRGHRVEPAEIEQVLNRHPAVVAAAVQVDVVGQRCQVVAFLQLTGEPDTRTVDAIADYAKRILPHHMVPLRYAALDRIPVNSNGKVDRAALARLQPPSAAPNSSPRSGVAAAVAQAWQRHLGARASADANFLTCGGTVAEAVAIVSELNREFDLDMPATELYRAPTVGAYAQRMRRARLAAGPGATEGVHWLRATGELAPVVLASGAYRGLLDAVEPDRPLGLVRDRWAADAAAVRRCAAAVAAAPGVGLPVLVTDADGVSLTLRVAAELHETADLPVPVVVVAPPASVPAEVTGSGGPIVCVHDSVTAPAAARWQAAGGRTELLAVPTALLAEQEAERLAGVVAALS